MRDREREDISLAYLNYSEILENPNLIQGDFDIEHLKKINDYIFKNTVYEERYDTGKFRIEIPAYRFHRKVRELDTGLYYLAVYSNMDKPSIELINNAFKKSNPLILNKLSTDEFIKEISNLYSIIDYVHPFNEGNSRTLRCFTKILAQKSGFTINWKSLSKPEDYSILYAARDISVLKLACQHLQHTRAVSEAQISLKKLEQAGYKNLPELLKSIIKKHDKQNTITKSQEQNIIKSRKR